MDTHVSLESFSSCHETVFVNRHGRDIFRTERTGQLIGRTCPSAVWVSHSDWQKGYSGRKKNNDDKNLVSTDHSGLHIYMYLLTNSYIPSHRGRMYTKHTTIWCENCQNDTLWWFPLIDKRLSHYQCKIICERHCILVLHKKLHSVDGYQNISRRWPKYGSNSSTCSAVVTKAWLKETRSSIAEALEPHLSPHHAYLLHVESTYRM